MKLLVFTRNMCVCVCILCLLVKYTIYLMRKNTLKLSIPNHAHICALKPL